MSKLALVVAGVSVVFCIAWVVADEPSYLGVSGCKTCHKGERRGDQFGIWEKGPHAKTYVELANEQSKEMAKKAGVEGDPQKADKCLKCHITGFGVPKERLGEKYSIEEGITCEACHGPGSLYKQSHIKDKEAAKKAGFVAKPDEASCKTCHNEESPTYKEFKYEEKVKQIAHPMPKKEGEKEEPKKEEEKKEEPKKEEDKGGC